MVNMANIIYKNYYNNNIIAQSSFYMKNKISLSFAISLLLVNNSI